MSADRKHFLRDFAVEQAAIRARNAGVVLPDGLTQRAPENVGNTIPDVSNPVRSVVPGDLDSTPRGLRRRLAPTLALGGTLAAVGTGVVVLANANQETQTTDAVATPSGTTAAEIRAELNSTPAPTTTPEITSTVSAEKMVPVEKVETAKRAAEKWGGTPEMWEKTWDKNGVIGWNVKAPGGTMVQLHDLNNTVLDGYIETVPFNSVDSAGKPVAGVHRVAFGVNGNAISGKNILAVTGATVWSPWEKGISESGNTETDHLLNGDDQLRAREYGPVLASNPDNSGQPGVPVLGVCENAVVPGEEKITVAKVTTAKQAAEKWGGSEEMWTKSYEGNGVTGWNIKAEGGTMVTLHDLNNTVFEGYMETVSFNSVDSAGKPVQGVHRVAFAGNGNAITGKNIIAGTGFTVWNIENITKSGNAETNHLLNDQLRPREYGPVLASNPDNSGQPGVPVLAVCEPVVPVKIIK